MKRFSNVVAVLPLFAIIFFPVFPAAQERDANVAGEAWWNLYTFGLPVATPSLVPDKALGVGHNTMDPDKVAAIGITLDAPSGSTAESLTLVLKEAVGTLGNINSDGAAVVACPITGPWAPVIDGEWTAVPKYDCELGKAAGKRSADGLWTFNLLSFGQQWLDAERPLQQRGILFLIEDSDTLVQVSFASIATGLFRLEFRATTPTLADVVEPVVVGGLDVPAEVLNDLPAADSAPSSDAEPAILVTQPAQNRTANIADPDLTGNLPWATWLLVPVLLIAAGVVSYALGPGSGDRSGKQKREGAVSRALSRRASGG